MKLKSMLWGWSTGLLLGALVMAPNAVSAEKEGEHDDANARREAMLEWYTDDYSNHGKVRDYGRSHKHNIFSQPYERFLNDAARRERERYASLMPDSGTSKPMFDSLAPVIAAANGNWTNIGPTRANYATNGSTLNVTDSGRVNAIVTDPANTNIIYVGFSGGGVWKSTDGGTTWYAKTETLGSLSVGTLEMDPVTSTTLYLGLGDPFDGTGLGMVKSTNGGDTWGNVVYLGNSTEIPDIEVSRSPNTSIVLAATNAGLYRSTDSGATFNKVTIATGQAGDPYIWSITYGGGTNFVLSLEADPADADANSQTLGQVWRSIDNGATWTQATGVTDTTGISRITVAAAPSDRNTMYALAANPTGYFAGSSTDLGNIFKSTDNGATWTGIGRQSASQYKAYTNTNTESTRLNTLLNGQGWYNAAVVVDPTNANIAYFGGALLAAKTTDGGTSYSQITNWLAQFSLPYVHADFHAAHIASNGSLYFGSDGGIFRSTNGGTSFTDTLNRGIASHLVYQVGSSLNNTNAVIVGLQDNGTRVRETNTSIFNQEIGGDGFGCNVNRANANLMLGSLYYNRIQKSTNAGLDFTQSCSGITECNNSSTGVFTTRIVEWKGDTTGNTVFTFAAMKAYKSTNYAGSWTALGTTGLPSQATPPTWTIRGLGVAKTAVNTVGLVASGGRAYRTTDGTNWTSIGGAALPGNSSSLSSISFDPTNAAIMYVSSVAPVATANHLWRSTNSGTNWTAIDSSVSGFPFGVPVNNLIVDPVTPTTLYAATHLGVYVSTNSGTAWTRYGASMPLVNVTDLYVANDSSLIRAATFGRSVWEYINTTNSPPTANFTFTTSGLTANFTDTSTDSDGTIASRAWTFGDAGTSTATNPSHTYASATTYTVALTVTDNGGAANTVSKTVTVAAANFTVTPSSSGNGTISPSTAQTVSGGSTTSFTLTPNTGYHINNVTGTCPAGSLSGNTWTTGAISANCTVIANFAIDTFTVTPSSSGNGSISPATAQTVNYNTTTSFTLTPSTGYHVNNVTGTCPAGSLSGNTWTTGAITANCTVIANFAIDTFSVTPSSSGNGTISPSTAQTVNYNTTTSFTLTPSAGYHINNVTGTCPAGSLSGNTWTTGAITANCTVIANFAINTYTVTPSVTGSGTISPSTAQTVNHNATTSFTLTPAANYHLVNVTGTCPAGSLSGNTWTTGAITANCTVIANFAIDTFTVTPSSSGNGTIAPSTTQTVNYNTTTSFTLTPSTGYHINNVMGTCPAGSLSGNTWTTGAITANCTVIANFAIDTFTVTPSSSGNGTISPVTAQTVNYNTTTSFTLTPSTGYHINSVTGTCPAGSLSGNTWTTGAITANCTVIANFAIDTFTVTPSSSGNGTISPATAQTVNYNTTTSFTLTPSTGYHINNVTGTCPAGTLTGNTWTTGAITANCTVIANFAINTYTVTAGAGANGTITPASQSVNHGSTASFTVTPAANYHVASVTGDTCTVSLVSGNNWSSNAITQACAVTATFALNTYNVTASVSGGNGTITPGSQSVSHGSTASFTVTPAANYHVANVTGDTCSVSLVSGNNWSSNAITQACAVTATFAIDTFTVTPSVTGNGSISPSTAQTVNYNTTKTFTLTPNTGSHIVNVTGTCPAGTLTGNSYTTGAVTANCTVIANFALDTFTVTPSSSGNGSISPNTAQTVNYNATTSFTLTPAANYHVASVTGTCPAGTLAGNTWTTGAITANCTVIANFAIDTYTVTAGAGANGSITPSSQSVNHGGTASFTVTPAANYHVVGVTGDTCSVSLVSGNNWSSNAITQACAVTATFAINTYTVTASAGANGSITPASQTVNHGGTAAFTVTPNTGYHVANVSGDTCTLTQGTGNTWNSSAITQACAVAATFAIDTFTVTPGVTGNGAISPNTAQTVNYNTTQTFTLTPTTGNHIVSVTGTCPAGTLTGNSYTTGAITANCTVIANFAIDTFTVTAGAGANGAITPASQSVNYNGTASFTVTPASNYHVASVTGDTCSVSLVSGNNWSSSAITQACAVTATFAVDNYTVTAAVSGSNGTITPASQSVNHGSTASFTVTPAANYHVASVTGSTCSVTQGTGNTWNSNAITQNCAVTATFAIDTHTVTAAVSGGNGTITPASQSVDHGSTASFTVTPAANYHVASVTGSTCSVTQGTGNTWNSNAITQNCAVTVTFALDVHTVTPAVTGNGTISPSTAQSVNHGATKQFTLTAGTGYHLVDVTGSCPAGSLSGNTWTTGAITADCTVTANFAVNIYMVTASSGGNGTITPAAQAVDHASAASFTVTPAANYHVASVSGDHCNVTLGSGNTWNSNAITQDCAVTATFAIDTHSVTASAPGGHGTITPASQSVNHGDTASFTINPAPTYKVGTVTGDTCTVSKVGNSWVSSTITQDCVVTATFVPNLHKIGGTVSGLIGNSVTLSLNGGAQTLVVSGNGIFQFIGELLDGDAYAVTVQTMPTGPEETCSIANGSGTATADVNDILVSCNDTIFKHGFEN